MNPAAAGEQVTEGGQETNTRTSTMIDNRELQLALKYIF